ADRQAYYASFTRDLCDKYLVLFADFKYVRSFFDSSLAAVPLVPDPFKIPGTNIGFSPSGISVPISNPFNPFTVGDTTLVINGTPIPMTTGVSFRGINDTGPRHEKITYQDSLFDVGLRGEMGEFGDYFKMWNWELGFRYSRNDGQDLSVGEASQPGLREALLDTNPATAFDPFLNFNAHNTKAARQPVYVTLHNSGEYELPIGYVTINGDLFKLPAGPLSFALGGEYNAQKPKVSVRWQPLDPKYIGALTLRGSYTEAFHAPALSEISPASTQSSADGFDPILMEGVSVEARVIGNPNLQPEVAYEWS